jgi:hypothetical protein
MLDPVILEALKARIKEQYAPMVKPIQDRRRVVEEEWKRNLDCYKAKVRADRKGFKGEWFNHYLPSGRRAVERVAVRVKQMLFPSPDFFEVFPGDDRRHDLGAQAEAWKNYLTWLLGERIKARGLTMQLLRTYLLFQRCIVKSYLRDDEDGLPWPHARAVDPFLFFAWPETAPTLDQAQLLFEHTMVPMEEYEALAEKGATDPIARTDVTKPDWPTVYVERLGQSGLTPPTDVPVVDQFGRAKHDPLGMLALTELWFRVRRSWVQSWLVWNVKDGPRVVRVQPTFTRHPYRAAFARQVPGEHYAPSLMSDLEPLNILLNDQMNMTCEGQATSMFPPAAVNPDLVARSDSLVYRPRAKWLMDPAGLKFADIVDKTGSGIAGVQMASGLIDTFSGAGPLAEGTPARGMPRGSGAVNSLVQLSMADIRDIGESFEDDILTPLLRDLMKLTVDAVPKDQLARIPGCEPLVQVTGEFPGLLRWVGTLQAQDRQMRAQQMLGLLGQLSKMFPQLQQQGWTLDFGSLGKRVWRDALGERGADTLFVKMPPPPPGMPPGPGQPAPPGAQPPGPPPQTPANHDQMMQQMGEQATAQDSNATPGAPE